MKTPLILFIALACVAITGCADNNRYGDSSAGYRTDSGYNSNVYGNTERTYRDSQSK